MKISNIPLNLILLTALTPMVGFATDIFLFHFSFLILIFITSIILLTKNYKLKIEYDLLFITFLVTIIVLALNVLISRGFIILALGGYVIFCSFLFQNIYFLDKKISIKTILIYFNFFYKFFLTFLLIEFFLILIGHQVLLASIFDGYKDYNSFDTLRLFSSKFDTIGGLNSIFLGSQLAGTISLLSFIWFSLAKKLNFFFFFKKFIFWKYLSLFFLISAMTATNFFLMIIFIFLIGFRNLKNFSNKFLFAVILIFLFFLIFYLISNQLLYTRIFGAHNANETPKMIEYFKSVNLSDMILNFSKLEYYFFVFSRNVVLWYEQGLIVKLIGVGNYLDPTKIYVGGEFAYGSVLLFNGLLFTFFFTVLFFKFILNFFKSKFNNQYEDKIFQYFSLVAILLFFSLVHYPQALVNSGIILFFAFHISMTNLMSKHKIKFKNT
jgi:hypothetical protein